MPLSTVSLRPRLPRKTTAPRAVMTCFSSGRLGFWPIRARLCRILNDPKPLIRTPSPATSASLIVSRHWSTKPRASFLVTPQLRYAASANSVRVTVFMAAPALDTDPADADRVAKIRAMGIGGVSEYQPISLVRTL